MVKVPNPDIETAIRIYYQNPEIGNAQIKELVCGISETTIGKMKRIAQKLMTERGQRAFRPYTVNTVTAYEAWELDIDDLERRQQKLKKLGLIKSEAEGA